ncbi:MAG: GNAT family N-acetyltransferase [Acidimicrobiales bacterium]
MLVRDADLSDAEAIARIYNREVVDSTHTFDLVERTLEQQRDYIRERSGVLAVLVAVDNGISRGGFSCDPNDGPVIGFGALSFYRDRPGYRTSVENSVYVHRDHHRKGVGGALLGALVERAATNGFHAVFARGRRTGSEPGSPPAARLRTRWHRTTGRPQVRSVARRCTAATPAVAPSASRCNPAAPRASPSRRRR